MLKEENWDKASLVVFTSARIGKHEKLQLLNKLTNLHYLKEKKSF